MFIRVFRIALKPNQRDAFARTIAEKCVPILQEFKGFRDEISMVSVDGKEGIGISFWDRQEDADVYERAAYADVRKALEPVAAGAADLNKYQLTTSTLHALAGIK